MSVIIPFPGSARSNPASGFSAAAEVSGVTLATTGPHALLSQAIRNHSRNKNACIELGHYQAQSGVAGFCRSQDMDALMDLFLLPVSWDGKATWDIQCLNRHAVINVFNAILRHDSRMMSEKNLTRLISVLARDELAEHEDKWILTTLSIVAEGRGNYIQDAHIDALETFALTNEAHLGAVDKIIKIMNGHLDIPMSLLPQVRPA